MRSSALISVLLVGSLACNRSLARKASASACPATWHAAWSVDSSIALCLPTEFARAADTSPGAVRWQRSHLGAPDGAWLSIRVDTSRTSDAPWPPHVMSLTSCVADCPTADSVMRHVDSLRVGVAYVETALVTGGYPGFRRQPYLVGGWTIPTGGRVWVNGFATRGATLDTLRAALRTVELRSP